MRISLARARSITAQFARQRILVVGDLMLDRYIIGNVDRISPEAPVPVVRVAQERNVPGGAANVAMNIQSLGGHAVVAGIVGEDHAARELAAALHRAGIATDGVMHLPGARTTVKTRIVAERQQVVRVDWEDRLRLAGRDLARFSSRLRSLMCGATGAILDDYDKGVIRQDVVDAVLGPARKRGVPVGFDPKRNHTLRVSGVTLATPNSKEAHEAAGVPERPADADPAKDESLRRVGRILLQKWRPEQLIVTLGARGMYLISQGRAPRVIPTKAREVYDVSGAGDTVIAACLLAIAAGADYHEAAVIGNYAAGVVVGKLGTATCSRAELETCIAEDEKLEI